MRNFQPISRRISETVQDRTKLLLITNRNSHIGFKFYQNHRHWMTLNSCKFIFSRNFVLVGMFGRGQ